MSEAQTRPVTPPTPTAHPWVGKQGSCALLLLPPRGCGRPSPRPAGQGLQSWQKMSLCPAPTPAPVTKASLQFNQEGVIPAPTHSSGT